MPFALVVQCNFSENSNFLVDERTSPTLFEVGGGRGVARRHNVGFLSRQFGNLGS